MFTRRTATVTMSAPEASCACAMIGCDEYLPVPTIRREANVRPAMTKGVSVTGVLPASAYHSVDPRPSRDPIPPPRCGRKLPGVSAARVRARPCRAGAPVDLCPERPRRPAAERRGAALERHPRAVLGGLVAVPRVLSR